MKKSLLICSYAALVMAFAACSDDNKSEETCEGEGCDQLCEGVAMPEGKTGCVCKDGAWADCNDPGDNSCKDSAPAGKTGCVCKDGAWTECKDPVDNSCTGAMPEGKKDCVCKDGAWTECKDAGPDTQDCEGVSMPEGKKDCVCKDGAWTECKDAGDNSCTGAMPEGKKDCECVDGAWTNCKDDPDCEGDECNQHEVEKAAITRSIKSTAGCVLDADCAEGSFCFEGQCVMQCSPDKSLKLTCDKAYKCDASRGRCVSDDYIKALQDVESQISAAGDTMSEQDKALLRASVELKAATMSNVRHTVLGQPKADGNPVESITFSRRMPMAKILELDKNGNIQNKQTVSFSTTDSLGDVQYVVKMPGVDVPVLKTSKGVKNDLGGYTYSFEIDAAKLKKKGNRLRSGGTIEPESENVEIISNAGDFPIVLAEPVETYGIYKGYVSPDSVLSGIDLPIRMGIKTVPAKVASYNDITDIYLYLPVSDIDIFSPENIAEDGTESWTSLKMSKKPAAECEGRKQPCFAAEFSTNDYAPKGSVLFGADHKVNRNLRVEIFAFDAPSMTFTGRVKDGLKGLYREKNIEGDKVNTTWNDTKMVGTFDVRMSSSIDESIVIHDHKSATESIRKEADEPAMICEDEHIAALMNKLVTAENCEELEDDALKADCNAGQKCKNAKTLEQYNALTDDEKWGCLQRAVVAVVDDPGSMSKVLSAVLQADAASVNSSEPIAKVCNDKVEIHNFDDFQKACVTEGCTLCADHPEYVCAADLLARRYLKNDLEPDAQAELMRSWIAVIRESYLAQQYMSWNDDNDIRKQWLTGAVYEGTFAANTMDDWNEGLLKSYREKVLDVQRDVMHKQFSQTTLEMLAQTFAKEDKSETTLEISSARNAILSELAQTWESVGTSLGLSARRYDVLSQDDAKRKGTAKELRPYLFDLYFAGVLESAINLRADQGSLNAAYGTNLSSIIGKIESLDQTFEELVFMRDGEILKDNRVDAEDESLLTTIKTAAGDSLEKAITKRKTVFEEMSKKRKEKLSVQDSYLTALESMRAELVNLCGYPSDCQTKEQQDNCKIFTAPYFCGFALESTSSDGVSLDKPGATISQVTEFSDCVSAMKQANKDKSDAEITVACAGGSLAVDTNPVSTTGGTAKSEAGIAILEFRKAELEYQTALAEYDVMAQKVRNNYATLDAYAANIEKWYKDRSTEIKKVEDSLKEIKKFEKALENYNSKVSDKELEEAREEFSIVSQQFTDWDDMAYDNMATQESMQAIITGATISDIWVSKAAEDADQAAQLTALNGILTNTAVLGGASTAVKAEKDKLQSTIQKGAADALGFASAGLQTAIVAAESAAALTQNAFDYKIEKLDRQAETDLAELHKRIAEEIDGIKVTVAGYSGEFDADKLNNHIADAERANDLILAQMDNLDQYNRDRQEMELKRNEFINFALDLIPLAQNVKVKDIARYRALLEYLTIAQRAGLVADQYDSKLSRYQLIKDALGSASEFFQTASDLESVESFIEYARNDLSDYLAAIEYLTVRPYVELRRSIYTARGTNDLEAIYKHLDDLRKNCGSGKESTNKVIISVREQLGIPNAEFDGLTPADRFHLALAKGNLPVSAQTRYTVTGTVADELKTGSFSSASFNINTHFANIDTSCNAKIDSIKVRFISKEGKKIRESGNLTPAVSLFYGGQTQLLSCHKKIEAITKSIGPRTTYGKFSTFTATPFAGGINAGIYEVPEGEEYVFTDTTELSDVTEYNSLKGYPLLATYSIVFDPAKGNNSKINWDNVADIEMQINYTTGSMNNDDACKYDIQ